MKPLNLIDMAHHFYMSEDGSWQVDGLLQLLIYLVIFDVLTGLAKAFFLKKLNSSVSFAGWGKHFAALIVGVFVYPPLSYIGFEEIASAIVGLGAITYAISVLENLTELGFPFPKWVKDRLEKVKESIEDDPE